MSDLKLQRQSIKFSGIHHNGIAERSIRTISTSARTILLHVMIHWPEQTSLDMWPFAVDYATFIWNKLPRGPSNLSPEEIFYGVKSDHNDIRSARVWGCPTYVLHLTLQDGKKLPRWEPRSKIGQFVGRSSLHSSTVALIKNTETGKISPQFHTVFDDHFTTLSVNKIPELDSIPKEWIKLFTYNRECHVDPADAPTLHPSFPRTPHPPEGATQSPLAPEGATTLPLPTPEGARPPTPPPKVRFAPEGALANPPTPSSCHSPAGARGSLHEPSSFTPQHDPITPTFTPTSPPPSPVKVKLDPPETSLAQSRP